MAGVCKFHGDCLEGLASVPAFFARWKEDFVALKSRPNHLAWEREAFYAAQLCVAVTCLFAPSKIVLGGRIMKVPDMVQRTRDSFYRFLGNQGPHGMNPGYSDISRSDFLDGYDKGTLGYGSGLLGSLVLAALMHKKPAEVINLLPRD